MNPVVIVNINECKWIKRMYTVPKCYMQEHRYKVITGNSMYELIIEYF